MNKLLTLICVFLTSIALAQTPKSTPDKPFQLATFSANSETHVGLVLGSTVLEIQGANRSLTKSETLSDVDIPDEMRALIESYDTIKGRLYQIANYYSGKDIEGEVFAHDVDDVVLRAPIRYPYNLLAVAANYQDHAAEMARKYGNANPQLVDPDRGNPVFFAKSPRSSIIDPGSEFPIPPTDKLFDWENELAIVCWTTCYQANVRKRTRLYLRL